MEKQKKSKNKILFIFLFILIIIFLINTSAVFFTAGLPSAVNKIFNSITTFVSNTFLFDLRPDIKQPPFKTPAPLPPEYGTHCEVEGDNFENPVMKCVLDYTRVHLCAIDSDCKMSSIKQYGTRCVVFKYPDPDIDSDEIRCVVTEFSKTRQCNEDSDCDKSLPIIPVPPLTGTRCEEINNDMRCVVNPNGDEKECYRDEDCNRTHTICSFSGANSDAKCLEVQGLGASQCRINKDCKNVPNPSNPPPPPPLPPSPPKSI